MVDTAIADCLCPYCGYKMDTSKGAMDDTARPEPGDISVCLSCGEAGIFNEAMAMRQMTEAERASIPKEQRLLLAKSKLYCVLRGPLPHRGGYA